MASKTGNKSGAHKMRLAGELTIYNALETKTKLLDAIARNNEIDIDLGKVNEMDTAGFQLLVLAKREAANQEKLLRLVNRSESVQEVINLFHMAEHFGDPIASKRKGKR